eukprot:s1343_g13.t1
MRMLANSGSFAECGIDKERVSDVQDKNLWSPESRPASISPRTFCSVGRSRHLPTPPIPPLPTLAVISVIASFKEQAYNERSETQGAFEALGSIEHEFARTNHGWNSLHCPPQV